LEAYGCLPPEVDHIYASPMQVFSDDDDGRHVCAYSVAVRSPHMLRRAVSPVVTPLICAI
jgi:hypothetical protein